MKITKNLINSLLFLLFLFITNICFAQDYYLEKCEGDKQIGLRGIELKNDFVVRLYNAQNIPVSNSEILFYIVEDNKLSKNLSYLKTSQTVLTDENGYAKTRLVVGKSSNKKLIVIAGTKNVISNPVYFNVSILNKNWFLLMLIELLGGTALLLFGMFKINSAFQKIASQNIRIILSKFTSTRIKGFFTGLFVTGINQSSSATLLLQVTLVSAGMSAIAAPITR